MSKLPERDQAELMLLQYAEHYDPERSRLSCQLTLNPELNGMTLTIAPEE
jgi:2Fe-2S ferredoxin